MSKIVLITGASSGIGRAIAIKCAEQKYDLILTARRQERLIELKEYLTANFHVSVYILCFDIQQNDEVVSSFNSLPSQWRDIDILINNAGLALGLETIDNGTLWHWEQMIDTNLKGLLYITKLVSAEMVRRHCGAIVNIGSIAGKEVYQNGNVYCATKHAVDALTKAMRIDLLRHNIKVSQVAPGMVNTEFSLVRFEGDTQRADSIYNGLTPLMAEDVADAVMFVITRPPHVTINDIVIMPTCQANTTNVLREV